MLKTFIRGRQESEQPVTIEQYNAELSEAEDQYEKGGYVIHEQLLKSIQTW